MCQAYEAVVTLATAAGCAVAVMPDAKGMFPETHGSFIGERIIMIIIIMIIIIIISWRPRRVVRWR
jgi:thiamine pyrophosphate-dependent acetolactate synthase large subunit-like protein